jgi:hypothetical protein
MPISPRHQAHLTTVVRAGWGCALLLVPGRILGAGVRPPIPAAAVAAARVLGARQLLQAVVMTAAPTRAVAALGAAVDGLHAGTDVALAAASPRWRRIALFDAGIATCLAASTWSRRGR